MDRVTVYADQIPLETDILRSGQYAMTGLGKIAEAVLGAGAAVTGFTLSPTAPASLNLTLGPGQVYQQENLEATPWSSLPSDARTIVKQGLLLDAQALTFTPPTTVGYAQNFLVEVSYADSDTLPVTLPYYNASNPDVQYNGPSNDGSAQNTVRRGVAAVQIKAGVAATSGSQTTPSPDAGWAGLFVVTLAYGQITITAGNIVQYASAPFIPVTLPGVPTASQSGKWVYAVASGTNDLTASVSPAPPAIVDGLAVRLFCPNTNSGAVTLALNGASAAAVVTRSGAALKAGDIAGDIIEVVFKGGVWRFRAPARSELAQTIPSLQLVHTGAATTGGAATATSLNADVAPNITAYEQGALYTIKTALDSANGGTTANFDGVGGRSVKRADGTAIQGGDWTASSEIVLVDNGSELRLVGFSPAAVAQSPIGKGLFTDTTPGTRSWPVPAGVYYVYATCVGGGGGGSGCQSGGTRSGAGGGAGGTAAGWIQVTPGQSIPYVVGPGSAGAAYQTNSANGGTSSISNLMQATGGMGTGNSGLAGGAGGLGSGGQINLYGGSGVDGNSVDPRNPAGAGGASSLGGGGRSATVYQSDVSDGRAPGSGGGGTYNANLTSPGGNGAAGYVSFQY